mgnify:CR=1 FL=1
MHNSALEIVAFILGEEEYGMEIAKVQEIIRVPEKTTKLPNTAEYFLGVTNLRDDVIPVIDLKHKFMNIRTEYTEETRVVVIEVSAKKIGLIVDEVVEVMKIPADMIMMTETINASINVDYLMGIARLNERLLILLNGDTILN